MVRDNGLKVEYVPVETIRPYAGNAKLHPPEQIAQIKESIRQFGMADPIGVWHDEIVEGHGRLIACEELGMQEVPIIRLDHLSDEQRKAYTLAHNKLTMNSAFDLDMLTAELESLSDSFDMSDFGFDESDFEIPEEPESAAEVNLLTEEDLANSAAADDIEVEPPVEPLTKPGDLWLIGGHRLLCGDSTKQEDLDTLMDGAKADMLLTDPPYNVDIGGKNNNAGSRLSGAQGIMNDNMNDGAFRKFLVSALGCAFNSMKLGGAFYIWHADVEGYNFRGAVQDCGEQIRQCLIWYKDSLCLTRLDYQWIHESCLYGWKAGASHKWCSDRKQTTVLCFDRPKRSKEHPTMKPVALFTYLVLNSSQAGDVVLDVFGGSGTTLVSCEQQGRKGYLMELDPKYCDVIVNRYAELTGKTDVYCIRDGEKYTLDEIRELDLFEG